MTEATSRATRSFAWRLGLITAVAFAVTRNQELWIYFLIAAIALVSIEWITYHRRITV